MTDIPMLHRNSLCPRRIVGVMSFEKTFASHFGNGEEWKEMKKVLFLSVVICGVFFSAVISGFAQEKLNLAVAEFEARNVSQMDAATISDFLRTELVKSDAFNVVDRSNMQKILAE